MVNPKDFFPAPFSKSTVRNSTELRNTLREFTVHVRRKFLRRERSVRFIFFLTVTFTLMLSEMMRARILLHDFFLLILIRIVLRRLSSGLTVYQRIICGLADVRVLLGKKIHPGILVLSFVIVYI
ncbi:hypothetical protein PUN28_006766 [Cardiocondyla obscurior]|uniref:Uncharacterized protein n=1 Tax=Cardiocondyla obscurior TaxID=286306 RepID=A0AAW2FZM3_9HYME